MKNMKTKIKKRTVLIFVLAFGFSEVFEGIILGLMDQYDVALELAVAILIHNSVTALYHGFEYAHFNFKLKWTIFFVFMGSLFTPIGIIIGLSIPHVDKLLTAIFFQLTVGIFIYVACNKIITHEFKHKKYNFIKILLILLGGIVVNLLWLLKRSSKH